MISRLGMCWNTITEKAKSNSSGWPMPKRPHQCGVTAERSLPLFRITCALGNPAHRLARLPHHFAADIHRVDLAEEARESAGHPAGAAADFEHPHLLRIAALADIRQVVEDLFLHGDLAGLEELLVGPLGWPVTT